MRPFWAALLFPPALALPGGVVGKPLVAANATLCNDASDTAVSEAAAAHGLVVKDCAAAARLGFCEHAVVVSACPASCGACRRGRSLQAQIKFPPPSPSPPNQPLPPPPKNIIVGPPELPNPPSPPSPAAPPYTTPSVCLEQCIHTSDGDCDDGERISVASHRAIAANNVSKL
eukprot:3390343-Prymnesium_polylepis.1